MERSSDALLNIRQTMKFYDQCLDNVRETYGLSRIETIIISFLHNNPGEDTAAAISDMRMLSKGNVSRAVESLIGQGLLERCPDTHDRRWVHLHLLPAAEPIIAEIEQAGAVFARLAFEGFSKEDMEQFHALNRRLADNVRRNLERSASVNG